MARNPRISLRRGAATTAVALTALAVLTGCGQDARTATVAAAAPGPVVTVVDPWVKAADAGMTAAFGTLRNTSGEDVRIVSATTSVAGRMELHEVGADAAGKKVMRPKEGGFVVPAGGTHTLAPGGDHLMFLDLKQPVRAGDSVAVTLTAADGATIAFTAPGRTFTGGKEDYVPGGMEGMGGMGGATGGPTPTGMPSMPAGTATP